MNTPVVFILFNRPDATRRVFEAIRQARPPRLFVIADGPRPDRPEDARLCAETRAVVSNVDWPCETHANFSDTNLGCRRRIVSGLDWVFANTEEAIILEDDCLPHPTFFPFCEELLARYRHAEKILLVSGDNFQPAQPSVSESYYFSRIFHIWGWATWRRAWRLHDPGMQAWPALRFSGWLETVLADPKGAGGWTRRLDDSFRRRINTWDYAWTFTCWRNNGLCILPAVNLVSNIGFGSGATHTMQATPYANLPVRPMEFPLCHPDGPPRRDTAADAFTERTMFKTSLRRRFLYAFLHLAKKMLPETCRAAKPHAGMTFEQAVAELRKQPRHHPLLADAYLDDDPRQAARRFAESAEFAETLRLLGPQAAGVVVDVGAGNGIAACAFAGAGAREVIAMEPDPGAKFGREAVRLAAAGLPVRCLNACAEAIPLPDNSVDVVYVRQALHHLGSLDAAFREFARILRPGGRFLAVREPIVDSPTQLRRFLAVHPIHQLTGNENAHGVECYLEAAENAGLRMERVLGHWESIVNAFPAAKIAGALERYAETYLRLRLGSVLGKAAARVPGVQSLAWCWLKRPVAGRLFAMLAQKPAHPIQQPHNPARPAA